MIWPMSEKSLDGLRQKGLVRLRHIVDQAKRHGVSPSRLAQEAGLTQVVVNRKLSGTDRSVIKQQTLAQLEEALARLTGKPVTSSEALLAEFDATNNEIAQSLNDLVRTLIERGILKEDDLPPRLRDALRRRRALVDILGLTEQ